MNAQAPERIVLKAAGTSLIMRVQSAEWVPVGKYPEYAFIGVSVGSHEGRVVELRVPKASADRQLGRLELVLADTVGKTLLFSRDPSEDPAKPFWGITLVSGAKSGNGTGGATSVATGGTGTLPTHTTTPTAPTSAPEQTNEVAKRREKRSGLYVAMTAFVLDTIVPLYEAKEIAVTANDVHAMVACLFIAETRNG